MITKETLEEVKQRLIRTYKPLEIYLFGSYAWGHPDEDSDLDLLIVVDKLNTDRYRALVEGHRALKGMLISKDLLILTKEEFEKYSRDHRLIYFKIRQKGKKIYACS